MQAFTAEKTELLATYGADANRGLTEAQAQKNKEQYGANALTRRKPDSLLKRLWDAATEPMLLMLIAAGLIALAVNIVRQVTGGEADFLECVGVFVAIALSVVISVVMEGRSAKAFEALSKINADMTVRAVRDGQTVTLQSAHLVVGDVVLLSAGDKVPADGRLLESTALRVDESALTGESFPVKKDSELVLTDEKTPLAERANMLYSGTFVTEGNGRLLVTAVGDATEFGKIAGELGNAEKSSTPLQEKLARLGKTITVLGVIAAGIVFAAQLIFFALHGGLHLEAVMEAFITSIVLIVAAVPEGLPTIVAVSLSINIIKLSKQNALVKKMIASETIGCISVICSDKTGTLTENKMTVRAFYDTRWHKEAAALQNEYLTHNICLNTTADLAPDGGFIGNPTECAMLRFFEQADTGNTYRREREDHTRLCAFPFSSELKHMTTISNVDGRILSYVKGSPECVLDMCALKPDRLAELCRVLVQAEEQAMRVIAFAHKELAEMEDFFAKEAHRRMESDMVFDGFVAIADPLRSDVYDAVAACRSAGVGVKILTGDGINDAPALKNADVGIAMGISGTEVSKEASDIVLLDDSFATIVKAVEWGRNIYENFKRFISFQLTVNIASVICVFVSVLMGLPAPFTALQLLWINIIMDGPPALTLGLEPGYSDLMRRRPTNRSENIISKGMLARITATGVYMSVVFLLQYKLNFLGAARGEMTTVLFTLFVLFQLFNAFNCRELHSESILCHLFKNKLMLLVVGCTFVLQVLIIQFAGAFFGTVPLGIAMWGKLFALAFSVIVLSEVIKVFARLFQKKKA